MFVVSLHKFQTRMQQISPELHLLNNCTKYFLHGIV
jgi:hypothetical protein